MDRPSVFGISGGFPFRCSDQVGEHFRICLAVVGDFAEEHEDHGDAKRYEHDNERPPAARRVYLRCFLQKCRIRSFHHATILNKINSVFNGEGV